MKKAVIRNIALAVNLPDEADANEVAVEVVEAINTLLKQANFGLVEPFIVSYNHPVSMILDPEEGSNYLPSMCED